MIFPEENAGIMKQIRKLCVSFVREMRLHPLLPMPCGNYKVVTEFAVTFSAWRRITY